MLFKPLKPPPKKIASGNFTGWSDTETLPWPLCSLFLFPVPVPCSHKTSLRKHVDPCSCSLNPYGKTHCCHNSHPKWQLRTRCGRHSCRRSVQALAQKLCQVSRIPRPWGRVLLCLIDPRVRKIRNEASYWPGIFSSTLRLYYVAISHCNDWGRGSGAVRVIGIQQVQGNTRRHWGTRIEVYISS